MKTLKESILSSTKTGKSAFRPHTKEELIQIIKDEIDKNGLKCSLNHIDTSEITDMSCLFSDLGLSKFNGDISKWNVSKVIDMTKMFFESNFNGDISEWDVSRVKYMNNMFCKSKFKGNLSKWKVSKVIDMNGMFAVCSFNGDISDWKIGCTTMYRMFSFNKKFNQDISKWDVCYVGDMCQMFEYTNYDKDISNWKINPDCDTTNMFYKCKTMQKEFKPFKKGKRVK